MAARPAKRIGSRRRRAAGPAPSEARTCFGPRLRSVASCQGTALAGLRPRDPAVRLGDGSFLTDWAGYQRGLADEAFGRRRSLVPHIARLCGHHRGSGTGTAPDGGRVGQIAAGRAGETTTPRTTPPWRRAKLPGRRLNDVQASLVAGVVWKRSWRRYWADGQDTPPDRKADAPPEAATLRDSISL